MNELLAIVGDDFERYYPDIIRVTVRSVNAITGSPTATAEGVAAAKTVRKRETGPARSGEVWTNRDEFWVRVDLLAFRVKPADELVEPDGTVWVLAEVNEVAGALVRCPVTKKM